jgi:GAF domain-containing protein
MYDPLVVDTFIHTYPDIAPIADRAGQDARSIIPFGLLDVSERSGTSSLEQIRANASESALLSAVRRELAKSLSVRQALDTASNAFRQLTAASVYAFYRYDKDRDQLRCEIAIGDRNHLLEGLTIRLGERVSGWTAATRRTSINSEAALDLGTIANALAPPVRSTASTTVARAEHLLGVLTAYATESNSFQESQRYAIEEIASALFDAISLLEKPQEPSAERVIRFPPQQA